MKNKIALKIQLNYFIKGKQIFDLRKSEKLL